jgi:parvulin-like peptidyl-prolyl isomerase
MSRKPAVPLTTKKHLARVERERIQRRWILTSTALAALAALALIGYGVALERFIEPGQPVAVVNGVEISTAQFQGRASLVQLDLISQYSRTSQYRDLFGSDAQLQSFIDQQLLEIERQLVPETLGNGVIDLMIDEMLVREEAARRGIVVSPEEVDDLIANNFGFYPHGTPTPGPTATPSPATPTPEPPTPTPTEGPSPTPEPTFTPGPSPTPFPTSTPYTLEAYQANYAREIEMIGRYGKATEADYRARYESVLYQQRLRSAFQEEVPAEQDQVWARQIVVADEEAAASLLERLGEGTPWETLENEVSEGETGSSADLGWFLRTEEAEIADVVFETPVGQVAGPIETAAGWAIVQVMGHEVRALNQVQLQQAAQELMNEWLAQARADATIEIRDYLIDRVPSLPNVVPQSITAN